MSISAILLAAGASTRMGELKALLDWRGRPLIVHQIDELRAGGVTETIVVLGHAADRLTAVIPDEPGVRTVLNPHYPTGRSSSILAGLAAVAPTAIGALILGVDQPTDRSVIAALLAGHAAARADLSVPTYQGRRGHPPLFSRSLFGEIATIDESSEGLKRVVRAHAAAIHLVPIDSPFVVLNLNRPADYAAALAELGSGPHRVG